MAKSEIERLTIALMQTQKERDAAIADLRELVSKSAKCYYCEYEDIEIHGGCERFNHIADCWQWHGAVDSEEEALEKCYELLDDLPADKDAIREFDGEWDTYERICEGNVCHVSYNKVSVEEN